MQKLCLFGKWISFISNVLTKGKIVNLALTQEPLKHLSQIWIVVISPSSLLSLLPLVFNG